MLTRLREFGGLQSYPSRTKDPDPVDFSTGSVGLGAVAPMFAALADRYLRLHFRESIASQPERRFVALVGDAELDEGNVWEAILEEGAGRARQRHDDRRPQPPEPRPGRARASASAASRACSRRPAGTPSRRSTGACSRNGSRCRAATALRERIDDMENEDYQILIRRPGSRAARAAAGGRRPARRDDLARNVGDVPDDDLPGLIGDLGGHDQVGAGARLPRGRRRDRTGRP